MPPYDPKANRPKLVPVDDSAPVDSLLGPDPAKPLVAVVDADTATGTAVDSGPRARLTVVPPSKPTPIAAVPAPSRFSTRNLIAVGVTVATVLGLMVAIRRRSE